MTLHTETYGSGTSLTLIHGWAMHTGIWRDFALQLARSYQVQAIDLPAHGRSETIIPFNLETVSHAIAETLTQPTCLLGWSLGASVAIETARRFPEKVNRLILLTGNPLFVQTEDWAGIKPNVLNAFAENLNQDCIATLTRFLALQINGLDNGKTLLKKIKSAIAECDAPDANSLQGGLEILKHSDLRTALTELNIPVLIILAEKDTLVPVAVAENLKQLSPNLNIQIIQGAGHTPFLSHSMELHTLIQNFLTGVQ